MNKLKLSPLDQRPVDELIQEMIRVYSQADQRAAVAKRLAVVAMRLRNRGRAAALRRHAFKGICEASRLPLEREHAHLDELDPELGYAGRLRWICPRANGSGKHSCGGCK